MDRVHVIAVGGGSATLSWQRACRSYPPILVCCEGDRSAAPFAGAALRLGGAQPPLLNRR